MMDWQPGDLALCVRVGEIASDLFIHQGDGLVLGRVYRVESGLMEDNDGERVISIEGLGQKLAVRFIKVTPPADMVEDTVPQSVEA